MTSRKGHYIDKIVKRGKKYTAVAACGEKLGLRKTRKTRSFAFRTSISNLDDVACPGCLTEVKARSVAISLEDRA